MTICRESCGEDEHVCTRKRTVVPHFDPESSANSVVYPMRPAPSLLPRSRCLTEREALVTHAQEERARREETLNDVRYSVARLHGRFNRRTHAHVDRTASDRYVSIACARCPPRAGGH